MKKRNKIFVGILLLAAIIGCGLVAWWWLDPGPWARDARHEIRTIDGKPFLVGEFRVNVKLPLNPSTRVSYVIPVDTNGKPLPSAANMVLYAPFNGEDGSTFLDRLAWVKPFWQEHGYTVFSLSIAANVAITDDVKQYYIYPECGWFEVVTAIQDHLCREFAIPERPFFVVGESAGGSMAQHMSLAIPERMEAAAWCGATRTSLPSAPNRPKLLALNTWGCPGMKTMRATAKKQREVGGTILHSLTPPHSGGHDHHAAGETAYMLIRQFIVDAVRNRASQAEFPSKEFQRPWATLPHEIADAWLEPETATPDALLVYPPLPDADRILFLVWEPDDAAFGDMMDGLYRLAQRRVVPVVFFADDRSWDDPELPDRVLRQILKRPEWQQLPIYVAGNGVGGQMAAVAALRSADPRIRQITTLNSPYEYPFERLSIKAARQNSAIPLQMLTTDKKLEEPLPDDITQGTLPSSGAVTRWEAFGDRAAGPTAPTK